MTAAFSFDGGHVYAPTGLYPDSIAVGNMNGDAFPDLVVGNYINGTTSRIDVLLGNGNGTFRLGSSINVPHRAEFIKIGDDNGDGKNDVFLGFNQVESAPAPYNFWTRGYVTLLAGNGNGTLQNPIGQIPLPNGSLDDLAVADFNKDGRADFAMTGDSGLYIDYSNGNGTFGNALTDASANSHGLWVADLNGDSRTDVLFSRDPGGGTSYVLGDRLQNADGTWQAAKTTPLLASPADVAVGDFNEDGKADVAASEDGTAVPFDGYYQVYVRWTADGTRANNVPIDVVSSTTTRTVTVNQQQNNGVWVSLGIYPFKTTGGSVLIRTGGTSGLVVADAVRFVAVPTPATVTKDNAVPTGITVTGSWTTSTEAGSFGANALNDGNPATKGVKSVAFAAGTLAVPGVYEIFGWWTAAANRASNARFDILTSTGTTTLSVNERLKGSQWVSLGYYTLNASGAKVTIRNDAANGYVYADAIRFVKV